MMQNIGDTVPTDAMIQAALRPALRRSPALAVLLPILLLTALLVPRTARAQDNQQEQALPDLAPRELEIRGQLEIQFPSMQRQPLVGFNPPPRIVTIPAGRRPFIEDYKQESADLPPSPLQRPEAPAVSSLRNAVPNQGEISVGAGRYFSRFGQAHVGGPIADQLAYFVMLDYEGSDGHEPFEEQPGLKNPFDALEGQVGLKTTQGAVMTGVTVDGFVDNYTMYGVDRAAALSTYPDRDGDGAGLAWWLQTDPGRPVAFDLGLRAGRARFQTDGTQGPAPLPERFISERRAGGDLGLSGPLLNGDAYLDARGTYAEFNGNNVNTYSGWTVDGGVGYRFSTAGGGYNMHLGARFIAFDAERQTSIGINDFGRSGNYISPEVRIDTYPFAGLQIYAQNSPGADSHTLVSLFRENPYLVDELMIQPTVRLIDAEAGVRYFFDRLQFGGKAGYQQMPNYLFFEEARPLDSNGFSRGLSSAQYAEATILHVGGTASVVLASRLHASVGLTLRDGTITYTVVRNNIESEEESKIPYFAPLEGQAMLAYTFAGNRALLQVTGTYEGTRYLDRQEDEELPAFIDLDALFSFDVTSSLGLILQGKNLLSGNLERWDHYPLSPQIITGGVRVRW